MGIIDRIVHRIKRRTVFSTTSPLSGEISVVDEGRERLLVINGETHSVYYKSGGWEDAAADYWGLLASPPFTTPPNPDILMLGLGGATAARLMTASLRPATITVAEADPAVVGIAREYFDTGSLPGLRVITGDGLGVMRSLADEGKRFDLVVDDAYFGADSVSGSPGRELLGAMAGAARPRGILVLNRPVDRPEQVPVHLRFAEELRGRWKDVEVRSVRGVGWNDVFYCRTALR